MLYVKLSELPLANDLGDTDLLEVTQGGISKKMTGAQMKSFMSPYKDQAVAVAVASANAAALKSQEAGAAAGAASLAAVSARAAWDAALAANPGINSAVRMNPSTIAADLAVPAGYNAVSAGPLTIGEGVTVTLSENSNWSIV